MAEQCCCEELTGPVAPLLQEPWQHSSEIAADDPCCWASCAWGCCAVAPEFISVLPYPLCCKCEKTSYFSVRFECVTEVKQTTVFQLFILLLYIFWRQKTRQNIWNYAENLVVLWDNFFKIKIQLCLYFLMQKMLLTVFRCCLFE